MLQVSAGMTSRIQRRTDKHLTLSLADIGHRWQTTPIEHRSKHWRHFFFKPRELITGWGAAAASDDGIFKKSSLRNFQFS